MLEPLFYCQKISEYLRRVELVCQAVPDGDAGILRELLDYSLPEAAVFDAVIYAREHACSVGDALFFAYLRA